MTNINNGFSDSQESALFDEETYKDIEKDVGTDLSSLMQNTKDLISDTEQKYEEVLNINPTIYKNYNMMKIDQEAELDDEEEKFHSLNAKRFKMDNFDEIFNFEYAVTECDSGQDRVYSKTLDKVYIKMDKVLPLRFTWNIPVERLYLRTALVFTLDEYKNDPVRRCHNHMADIGNNQNMDPQKIKHVVHCISHSNSIYVEQNEHFSILTPLCQPEIGMSYNTSYTLMCYKFLCKNSCPSGMNRRPTELVFTLEDHQNNMVLGCRKLLVRVCSCPKRDKQKEETELTHNVRNGKRKALFPMLPCNKIQPLSDKHVFKVELDIPGKENYLAVLKYAYDIMAGQAVKTEQYDFFIPFMNAILQKTP